MTTVGTAAGNLLVLQGGGPTPVLNTTLYGVIDEALAGGAARRIYGARFGVAGLVAGDLVDLSGLSREHLDGLKRSPGAALGSTRFKPEGPDFERIVTVLRRHEVRRLVVVGGNGSMRGALGIAEFAASVGYELYVSGAPKTVDNDIVGTDRCPGFGSAARFVAQSVRDLGMDVRGLPQPVSIFESMGRSVGWLAGASVLAKTDEDGAPHLVYLPERPFDTDRFLGSVDRVVKRVGWCVVVVNEGIRNAQGRPVYEVADRSQADALGRALPGGVAEFLAGVVTRGLGIRCRSEKPGLCGRSSMLHVSRRDREDAERVGREAVRAVAGGQSGIMVGLRPLKDGDGCTPVALGAVAGKERSVPPEFLADSDLSTSAKFVSYVKSVAGDLVDYAVPLRDALPSLRESR